MTWQQTIDEEKEISREEGIAEGAHNQAIETARRLIQMNLAFEQIADATGLSVDEVKSL